MSVEMTAVSARALSEPLLTADDLERLLQVDRRTISRLCKRGQLPQPLKLGGGNRWKAEEVADALDRLACDRHRHQHECETLMGV